MTKNRPSSLLPTVGLALFVVSIPLCAETSGTNAPEANPAPTAAPASSPADQGAGQVPPEVATAMQMPEGPDRTKAVVAAARAWGQKDAKGYLTWALALPMPLYEPIRQSASVCGKSPDVKAAADWLIQQDSPKITLILHPVLLGWAHEDAAAAEAWCMQLQTTRDIRFIAFFTVADALCRKDPQSAVAWLATLTPPDDRAATIDGTATIWCRVDLAATTAWIKQLSPVDMKRAALTVDLNWGIAKGKGDLTVEQWVNQLTLSAVDKDDVLKGPRPDSYHISKYKPTPVSPPNKT